jgi:hypothetical protein
LATEAPKPNLKDGDAAEFPLSTDGTAVGSDSPAVMNIRSYDEVLNEIRENPCLPTVMLVLQNVVNHPDEERFSRVSLSNRRFREKLATGVGLEFLKFAGFTEDRGCLVFRGNQTTAEKALSDLERGREPNDREIAAETTVNEAILCDGADGQSSVQELSTGVKRPAIQERPAIEGLSNDISLQEAETIASDGHYFVEA